MTITGFETQVPAPPLFRRDRGLLIDQLLNVNLSADEPTDPGTRESPPRPEGGLVFCKIGCAGLTAWQDDSCGDSEPDLVETSDDAGEIFNSFVVSADEKSPARFDEPWIRSRLASRMDSMVSAQLALELLTGTQTGNPSLQDSATHVVAAKTPPAEVMFVLEDILSGFEDLAFYVHMDPGTFAVLDRENKISFSTDDNRFRTPTGHTVIADAGHNGGLGPVDPDNPGGGFLPTAADGAWIYASLPVVGWVGADRTLGTFSGRYDRERNTRVDAIIRPALVAFDPCVVVAIQVDVPTYTVDTAGS